MITFRHIIDTGFDQLAPDERERMASAHRDFVRALAEEQHTSMVFFGDPAQAKVVRRRRDGRHEVLHGPYVQGAEFEGGYFIVEAASLDEAVEWAKRGRYMLGTNEVREIRET